MKTCAKCGDPKPLDEFHKNKPSPDGRHPYCKLCRKKMAAARYERNPDHYKAKNNAAYREKVGPKKPNLPPEELARRAKVATDRWRAANVEKVRAYARAYYWANRVKRIARAEVERARRAKATIGHVDIARVYRENQELYGEVTCVACEKTCKEVRAEGEKGMHVDHFWPLFPAEGVERGDHVQDNLVILCPTCNLSKGNRDPVEFLSRSWGLTEARISG